MGYDVHITRAEHWPENNGCEITVAEWHSLVEADPELRFAGYNGPHFAIWDGHPEDDEAWLDWNDGNITTKRPGDSLLRKMRDIAARLGAHVEGDDGELYDDLTAEQKLTPKTACDASVLALALSLLAAAMLSIVIPLDSSVRQQYPVGTAMPMKWAILLVGPGAVGVLAWLVGTVFAASAFLLRQPSLHWAGIALIINFGSAVYLAIAK